MDNKLPHRLKNLREEKGYLQKYVANEIGVRNNTLSGYENGSRSPDPDMILELARLYDVSTDYLLGYHDDQSTFVDEELDDFIDDIRIWYGNGSTEKRKKLRQFKQVFETFKDDV